MKSLIVLSAMLFAVSTSSCIKKVDLYQPDEGDNDLSMLDTNFKFSTRTTTSISLIAKNAFGNGAKGALFSVYSSNPIMSSDGGRDLIANPPIYQGFTGSDGRIAATIDVPIGTDSLYIYPEYCIYGPSQTVAVDAAQNLVFDGYNNTVVSKSRSNFASRAEANIERESIDCGKNYRFFTYFTNDEFIAAEGKFVDATSDVVSYENFPEGFIETVNRTFPEANVYGGSKENTDLHVVTETAEVWVSFIGDGGYTGGSNRSMHNGLYYYIYTDDNKPSSSYKQNWLGKPNYRLTAIFPNANPADLKVGTKVQLLYWDDVKKKYVKNFPKGTYIGFAMNYRGYDKEKNPPILGFSLNGESNNPYCSTPAFNSDGTTHGIIAYNKEYDSYLLGMERQGMYIENGKPGDCDFNDILAKITTVPSQLGQESTVQTPGGIEAKASQSGVLAFEDNWPERGDYDFNDFVTKYTYSLVKNTSNQITDIRLKFTPQAIGANSKNGFGIQLPISRTSIASITGGNATLEDGDGDAVVIVYNNVREAFGNQSGFINTQAGSAQAVAGETDIMLHLSAPVAESIISVSKFNPFLFVESRSHEIHLVDFPPTSKMKMDLLGTQDDHSDSDKGIYYRMDNQFPWALDISDDNWQWPLERTVITNAYLNFTNWYKDWKEGKIVDWMNDNIDTKNLWKYSK